MAVMHMLGLGFKPETPPEKVKEILDGVMALKDKCIHPETGKPFILNCSGGKDNSKEGQQRGVQYAFILEFASEAERDYYAEKDKAHQEFGALAIPHIATLQVNDFTPGQF